MVCIFRGIDSTRCWKHSRSWSDSITQLLQFCRLRIYNNYNNNNNKGALWDWDLVTVEAIGPPWTYCRICGTSLIRVLCDMRAILLEVGVQLNLMKWLVSTLNVNNVLWLNANVLTRTQWFSPLGQSPSHFSHFCISFPSGWATITSWLALGQTKVQATSIAR